MSGTAAGVAGVVCLLLAGLAVEAWARCRPGPATAAQAVGAAMRTAAGRAAVLLAWLWLGVHLLAR
ncbi:hypothetical protein JOD57_004865 [Geodermatophilus bullaregiensis]|uniref:DUF6186 family protein n=1 Tax=Geodermatophilus bullaregiensis TaxID=1564160 RepID=UPI001958A1A6|nr:DUF6186 family protein [Geodermatophilus bullaregiensis]MBM7809028.1 hypothetical protein [Geodermatophilus bullaregiensis]